MKRLIIPFLAVVIMYSCNLSGDEVLDGSVTLQVESASRTIIPDLSMNVDSYHILGTGVSESVDVTVKSSKTEITLSALEDGEWSFTVYGLNDEDTVITEGSVIVTVESDSRVTATVSLTPISGEGNFIISASWPEGLLFSPLFDGEYKALGETEWHNIAFFAGSLSASRNLSLPNGYYTVNFRLKEGSSEVWSITEVLRIVSDNTSTVRYELAESDMSYNFNDDSILSLQNNSNNPYEINYTLPSDILNGDALEITRFAVSPALTEDSTVEWYLNERLLPSSTGTLPDPEILTSGIYNLSAFVYDGDKAGSETTSMKVSAYIPSPSDLGIVQDIKAVDENNIVYAIDESNARLYRVDLTAGGVTAEYSLPYNSPYGMDYSSAENALFIIYKNIGVLSKFSCEDQSIENLRYSTAFAGRDLIVADDISRVFVKASTGLYIISTQDLSILKDRITVDGSKVAYSVATGELITGDSGSSPSSLMRYSISDDTLTLEQERHNAGSNGRDLITNKAGTSIVFPCGGGNGSGYTFFDFDPADLDNYFGEWSAGTYPKYAAFSYDDSILFAAIGDPYDTGIKVMDAHNYQLIKELSMPNTDDFVRFEPAKSGLAALGFSYDDYNEDDFRFYYFDNFE